MTDPDLADLFAAGSAPERDAVFAARVGAEIAAARGRRQARVLLAARLGAMLAIAAGAFAAAQALGPVLAMLADLSPRFMGVPAPLLLGVILIALLLRAPRLFPGRAA